eukprot:scaffold19948_cov16-Prasinocladus_malaysianus.AAC.1
MQRRANVPGALHAFPRRQHHKHCVKATQMMSCHSVIACCNTAWNAADPIPIHYPLKQIRR